MLCPICDCEEVQFAAVLGDTGHARCRDCGIVYTFTPEVDDVGRAYEDDDPRHVQRA